MLVGCAWLHTAMPPAGMLLFVIRGPPARRVAVAYALLSGSAVVEALVDAYGDHDARLAVA